MPSLSDSAMSDLTELAALHGMLLNHLYEVQSGTGSDVSKKDPFTTMRRPWLDPPEGFLPFDNRSRTALPAIGSVSTIVQFLVPAGYDGVINAYSWNFVGGGFTQASGDIVWQLLRNGVPIRNFDNITVEAGTPQIARPVNPIRIYSTQLIALVVSHPANIALNGDVAGGLGGYFYPSAN